MPKLKELKSRVKKLEALVKKSAIEDIISKSSPGSLQGNIWKAFESAEAKKMVKEAINSAQLFLRGREGYLLAEPNLIQYLDDPMPTDIAAVLKVIGHRDAPEYRAIRDMLNEGKFKSFSDNDFALIIQNAKNTLAATYLFSDDIGPKSAQVAVKKDPAAYEGIPKNLRTKQITDYVASKLTKGSLPGSSPKRSALINMANDIKSGKLSDISDSWKQTVLTTYDNL